MRKFVINVNGNQYEVEVDEIRDGSVVSTPAPVAVPVAPVAAPAPAAPVASGATGSVKITAPMPGTILAINVNNGDKVTKGQVLAILEAMKMENEIVAPQDGTVASVNVAKGASVNSGDVLVSLN